jgi:tripartite-type tricarboxylate transporter receptor subunit TctC
MDPKVVQVLHEAFKNALADPVFMRSIEAQDQLVTYMDPRAYTEWAASESEREKKTAVASGIKVE